MGEVDDVQDAVDQRQADGDQHIDAAGQQAVQHAGEDDLRIEHATSSRPEREARSGGTSLSERIFKRGPSTSLRFARDDGWASTHYAFR